MDALPGQGPPGLRRPPVVLTGNTGCRERRDLQPRSAGVRHPARIGLCHPDRGLRGGWCESTALLDHPGPDDHDAARRRGQVDRPAGWLQRRRKSGHGMAGGPEPLQQLAPLRVPGPGGELGGETPDRGGGGRSVHDLLRPQSDGSDRPGTLGELRHQERRGRGSQDDRRRGARDRRHSVARSPRRRSASSPGGGTTWRSSFRRSP